LPLDRLPDYGEEVMPLKLGFELQPSLLPRWVGRNTTRTTLTKGSTMNDTELPTIHSGQPASRTIVPLIGLVVIAALVVLSTFVVLAVFARVPAEAKDGCVYGKNPVTRYWVVGRQLDVCGGKSATLNGGSGVVLTAYDDSVNFRRSGSRGSTTRLVVCGNGRAPIIYQSKNTVTLDCRSNDRGNGQGGGGFGAGGRAS
jgi:hypothetical protein